MTINDAVLKGLRARIAAGCYQDDEELACGIAEHVLGWKPARIPPDARGENECEVLTSSGELPQGWQPNPLGRYARSSFIPNDWHYRNRFAWFATAEQALTFAGDRLGQGIRWGRDPDGTCRIYSPLTVEPEWVFESAPGASCDALAIIDCFLQAWPAARAERDRKFREFAAAEAVRQQQRAEAEAKRVRNVLRKRYVDGPDEALSALAQAVAHNPEALVCLPEAVHGSRPVEYACAWAGPKLRVGRPLPAAARKFFTVPFGRGFYDYVTLEDLPGDHTVGTMRPFIEAAIAEAWHDGDIDRILGISACCWAVIHGPALPLVMADEDLAALDDLSSSVGS